MQSHVQNVNSESEGHICRKMFHRLNDDISFADADCSQFDLMLKL